MTKLKIPAKPKLYIHIYTLLMIMDVGLPLYRRMTGFSLDAIEGDPLRRNVLIAGFFLSLLPFILKPDKMIAFIIKKPYIIFILIWVAASLLWTNYPQVAFRRIVGFYLTVFYTIALYIKFPGRSLLQVLGTLFLIIIIASILLASILPSWGVMSGEHSGSWRGVFQHKNTLGKYSVIAILFFSTLLKSAQNKKEQYLWIIGIILSLLVVFKSNSISAYILSILSIIMSIVIHLIRAWKKDWQVLMIILMLLFSFMMMIFLDQIEVILAAIGRDTTLTGRIPLWSALISFNVNHPLGFGYGTFWVGDNYPSGEIWKAVNWEAPHAHNGYIEIWLQLGWVGLIFCLITLAYYFSKHFFLYMKGNQQHHFWFILMFFIIVYNMSESNLMAYNSIYTVLILLAFFIASDVNWMRNGNGRKITDKKSLIDMTIIS